MLQCIFFYIVYEKQINIVSYLNAFLTFILELKMIYVSSLEY